MKKQLEKIIQKFKDSKTTQDSYLAISEFVELVFQNDTFVKYTSTEGNRIKIKLMELNADKGDCSKEWNKYRAEKYNALWEMDPWFPLKNLHNIHVGIQSKDLDYASEVLYAYTGPHNPMRDQDKKEYQMYLNKTYRNILPFIKEGVNESIETPLENLKYKSFDEDSSILTIGQLEIPIAKNKGNNKMHEIMMYLFIDHKEDLTKEFFYADIADERFGTEYNSKDKYAFKPYSTACDGINNKIKDATNGKIVDFLQPNYSKLGFVTINQKYL